MRLCARQSGPSFFFHLLLDSPLCPWQEELEEEETYTLVTCRHAACSLTRGGLCFVNTAVLSLGSAEADSPDEGLGLRPCLASALPKAFCWSKQGKGVLGTLLIASSGPLHSYVCPRAAPII